MCRDRSLEKRAHKCWLEDFCASLVNALKSFMRHWFTQYRLVSRYTATRLRYPELGGPLRKIWSGTRKNDRQESGSSTPYLIAVFRLCVRFRCLSGPPYINFANSPGRNTAMPVSSQRPSAKYCKRCHAGSGILRLSAHSINTCWGIPTQSSSTAVLNIYSYFYTLSSNTSATTAHHRQSSPDCVQGARGSSFAVKQQGRRTAQTPVHRPR